MPFADFNIVQLKIMKLNKKYLATSAIFTMFKKKKLRINNSIQQLKVYEIHIHR